MLQHTINTANTMEVLQESTLLGQLTLTEPVLIDLINSRAMQRLKLIHQYGVAYYGSRKVNYSRYQHSLGVMHILQIIGCSLQEQIAGLLHDVSHTVFSHVADVLFDHNSALNSYQDDIHEWYISKTDIPYILQKHGLSVADILHKSGSFKALEQNLPDLCADRLEYLLNGAFLEGKITQQEARNIFESLSFNDGLWSFDSLEHARQLAYIALELTEFNFASPLNIASYYWAAQVLRDALNANVITLDEIHFSSDDIIWKKLLEIDDAAIVLLLNKIQHPEQFLSIGDAAQCTMQVKPKFRGINPFVMTDGKLVRLSDIDQQFHEKFLCLKHKFDQGLYLVLK